MRSTVIKVIEHVALDFTKLCYWRACAGTDNKAYRELCRDKQHGLSEQNTLYMHRLSLQWKYRMIDLDGIPEQHVFKYLTILKQTVAILPHWLSG